MASCGYDVGEAQAFSTHLLGACEGGDVGGARVQRQISKSQAFWTLTLRGAGSRVVGSLINVCTKTEGHAKKAGYRVPGGVHQENVLAEVIRELSLFTGPMRW